MLALILEEYISGTPQIAVMRDVPILNNRDSTCRDTVFYVRTRPGSMAVVFSNIPWSAVI